MKKSKIFARKIIAIVLSVIMAASAFTGVVTVYAKSTDNARDEQLAANFMAWAETTDNQTAEAVLDYLDEVLAGVDYTLSLHYNYVVVNIDVDGYIDSIDGVLDLVRQAKGLLDSYAGLLGGDIPNIDLSPLANLEYNTSGDGIVSKCNKSYRAKNDAKDIVMALAQTIYYNSNDDQAGARGTNKNVIGQFIKGDLSLGSIVNGLVDVYGLIGDMLGMWSGYQSNLVYNVLAQLILTKTAWFTEEEVKDFQSYLQGNGGSTWNFDTVLMEKLSTELLSKISIEVTYAMEKSVDEKGETKYEATDSSKTRYAKICAYLKANNKAVNDDNIKDATIALNAANGTKWDPNIRYDANADGNVYIFRYAQDEGEELTFGVSTDDKFYDIVNNALKVAWYTVLKPTIRTMRVNDSMDWYTDDEGYNHGGNYDNNYYYWLMENNMIDTENWLNNYTQEKFNAYATAKYKDYGCDTVDEFKTKVQKALTYDRDAVEDPTYTWEDVDASNGYTYTNDEGKEVKENILFGKLRYSPLADKVFNMTTGPINLYIMQTGFQNLETFLDSYVENVGTTGFKYTNIANALNDCLVAAVKDLFPESTNVEGTRPELALTNGASSTSAIADTLIKNTVAMFQYAADAADKNILLAFYHNNGDTASLTEANFEEAMIPLAVSLITVISDTRSIHTEDWKLAKDAEGVGFLALREYLSYVLPTRDYDSLITTANGKIEAKNGGSMYEDVLLIMARDAVGYLLNSVVPCRDKSGNEWNVYTASLTDGVTLFDLLNSVLCYYGSTETFNEPTWNTTATKTYGKAVASLLGVVDNDGKCKVKMSNTIWQNIDAIANSVWPTLGVLQSGKTADAGNFDSEELIYNKIVLSLLDIGKGTDSTGFKGGLTGLVDQLLTIFTADPIMNKGVDVLVYDDVVASLVNGLFGARYSGQYTRVMPITADMTADEAKTPFDTLVQAKYFAKWTGSKTKENGILGILISNIYGDFGGSTECSSTFSTNSGAGCWQGAMFAVKSVSYFVDGFIPALKDHTFNAASVSVNDPSRSNVAANKQLNDTYITISNNATGLNRFYKDADGNIVRDDRYFIEITDLSVESQGQQIDYTYDSPAGKTVAPEKSLKIKLTAKNPSSTTLTTFTMKYKVYLGTSTNPKKTLMFKGVEQEAKCYLNFNMDQDWAASSLDNIDSDTQAQYPSADYVETLSDNASGANVYTDLVVTNNNPSQVDNFGMEVIYLAGLYATANADGTEAYATFNPENGDLIRTAVGSGDQKSDIIDYIVDTEQNVKHTKDDPNWVRGEEVDVNGITLYKGFTTDEMKASLTENGITEVKDAQGNVTGYQNAAGETVYVSTRNHITLSLSEDPNGDVIKQAVTDDAGRYTKVIVDTNAIIEGAADAATPTHGIDFAKFSYDSETKVVKWLKYDGTTSVKAEPYNMQLCGWDDNGDIQVLNDGDGNLPSINVIIANTDGANDLQSTYEKYQKEMTPYQSTDFDSALAYSKLNTALVETVQKLAAPVTLENADELISTTETVAKTETSKYATGDRAYKPMSVADLAALPADSVKDSLTPYNGYVYYDAEHKFAVYQKGELADADVTNGKDAVGNTVVKGDDGKYYLANSVKYKYAWDNETYDYPYYAKTTEPDTYEEEVDKVTVTKNYYNQVQFKYLNTQNMTVSSSDNWKYKVAITEEAIKENDGTNDYRGYYKRLEDKLTYNVEEARKHIKSDLITEITTGIIEDRKGLTNTNYDVATYEKMVQIAKEGESLVYVDHYDVDAKGEKVPVYATQAASADIKEAKRLYDKYKALVVNRGYEGNKLEAEILHTTRTTKANLVATYDEETGTASVKVTNGTAPAKGTLDADGYIVNDGSYSKKSWNNYIYKLAVAVATATEAKSANITGTYNAKKELVMAENSLAAPVAATTYTVEGTVVEATDATGTPSSTTLAGISVYADGRKIATTASNGTFTAEVPLGTTEVTFKGTNVVARTVLFDGATSVSGVAVGVVDVDFNNDGKINVTDVALAAKDSAKKTKMTGITGIKGILQTGVNYDDTID